MLMRSTGAEEYGPLSQARLAAFESRFGITLPDEYRHFLIQTNGGVPNRQVFDGNYLVRVFFGLHRGPRPERLQWACRTYGGRMPSEIIPVGSDPFGNVFCVGVREGYQGKVYFWSHEQEGDEDEPATWDNVRPIAESFNSFLEGLRPLD
jgi:hypothetical protein